MAEQLLTTSIQAPGFMGLNLQDSSVGLEDGFATEATNCVIDRGGRIGSRKGWSPVSDVNASLTGFDVKAIGQLITEDGTGYIVIAGNTKLFLSSGTTLTELTYGGGGSTPTITDDHWQMASLSGALYIYQLGHDPLVFDPATSTTEYTRVSEMASYAGTVQSANCVISAYGRTWSANTTTDKSLIQFSDLLAGQVLTTGTAGTLDITEIWPSGGDEIISLAAHNGFLYIFGRRQVLIYAGATDPSTMFLSDAVSGIGCLARDSVVVTGGDIVFLSDSGVRSLMRVVQEKSAPMRELSLNVKESLISDMAGVDADTIKAVYSDTDAFYLLSLSSVDKVYCFDMRNTLQNGAARTTVWTGITPKSFCYTRGKRLLLGQTSYVGLYEDYTDNTVAYRMAYYTNYFSFQKATVIKILKKVGIIFSGGNGNYVTLKWGFDYDTLSRSHTVRLLAGDAAEFGLSEYSEAEFTNNIYFSNKVFQGSGAGTVLQLGVETEINGSSLSVQKLDCYVKEGRTR